jgi:beta-galactosidase
MTDLHDWAMVFVNGKLVGKVDRRLNENSVTLPVIEVESQLDILVDATGRVNYGETILDRKGITRKVEVRFGSGSVSLENWEVYNFPVDYDFQKSLHFKTGKANGPAWHRGSFSLEETGDANIDIEGYGRGMVWINGYNIGRYWRIGPQQTLYMPGCWLHRGRNEIIVLDLEGAPSTKIKGVANPVLDKTYKDESLVHRKAGETLDLSKEKPVSSGAFTSGHGWKTIAFTQSVDARYICLNGVSPQKAGDLYATLAEIEVTGIDGNSLSRSKWSLRYADSEEVASENDSADRVYDNQESTFWHTEYTALKPGYPHQLVIDLGETAKIKGFRCLTRTDQSDIGMIKDYQFYVKEEPFNY